MSEICGDDHLTLPNEDLEAWLSALKPYQSSQIKALLEAGRSEHDVVDAWLSAQGPDSTAHFGGNGESKPFRDRFVEEFKKFVCGDKKYSKERAELVAKADVAKLVIVSAVSAAIGSEIGATAALLVPPVAVLLHIVGKIGLKAWCCDKPKEAAPTENAS